MAISAAKSATLAKLGIGAAAALAGIGIGLMVTGGGSAPAAGAAIAWIDQPLDGASFPDAPVVITVHAADPDGVATVTLSIDGTVILVSSIPGAPTLATVESEWVPTSTGSHRLDVVANDRGGAAGTPARTTFSIVDSSPAPISTAVTTTMPPTITTVAADTTTSTGAGSTTTSTSSTSLAPGTSVPVTTIPTVTTVPTITTKPSTPPTTTRPTAPPPPPTTTPPTAPPTTAAPTTTTPPCVPGAPIPTSPFDDEVLLTSTPTLTWAHRGCGPDTFTVQVADNDLFLSGRGSYVASSTVAGSARSTVWSSLACQRTYYWRVRSNGASSQSAWSPTQSFSIDC